MKLQMGNNILDFFLFPELILSIGTLIVLLFGLFAKKNIFSITSNLSVILLIIVGVIILADKKVSFANFNNFFIESSFIRFFQILVIIGSISSIVLANVCICSKSAGSVSPNPSLISTLLERIPVSFFDKNIF